MGKRKSFTGYQRAKQTRWSVRLADLFSRRLITIGGIGTIVTVMLVCVYLVAVVMPLFESPDVAPPQTLTSEKAGQRIPQKMAVDEYRLMGWSYYDDGSFTVFRLDRGEVIERIDDIAKKGNLTTSSFSTDAREIVLGYADGTVQLGEVVFRSRLIPRDDLSTEHLALEVGQVTALDRHTLLSHPVAGIYRSHRVDMQLQDPVKLGDSPVRLVDSMQFHGRQVLVALTGDNRLHVQNISTRENMLTGEIVREFSGGGLDIEQGNPGAEPVRLLLSGTGDNAYLVWSDGALRRYHLLDSERPYEAERVDLTDGAGQVITEVGFLLGRGTLMTGSNRGMLDAWFRIRADQVPELAEALERRRKAIQNGRIEPDRGFSIEATTLPDGRTLTVLPPDGWVMVRANRFEGPQAAVTSIFSSQRNRVALVGYDNGSLRLFQTTTGQALADVSNESGRPFRAVAFAPKEDAILALTDNTMYQWAVDLGFPQVSVPILFGRVWYEGSPTPEYVWQSSSADDAFEPKMSLIPLIFGTLKATVYSLLFGVPIALMAAIYTSEFLNPRIRSTVKPTIELMASLPSVVLGFLAALVIAPAIKDHIPSVLAVMFTAPLACLLGSQCWQMLPVTTSIRLTNYRLVFVGLFLILGGAGGFFLGPAVEATLFPAPKVATQDGATSVAFTGDFKAWLNQEEHPAGDTAAWLSHRTQVDRREFADLELGFTGRLRAWLSRYGFGGWVLLFVPLSALAVALASSVLINPAIRRKTLSASRQATAFVELIKFVVQVALTLVLACSVSALLAGMGMDPRGGGSFLGTYVQRNAMIVGFIMGFAIIPIIFTIAEDALSTVPDHLRAASLGAGATPWQTAVRIVIPTAMSGLFSAVMIGLGRAVGETMIVLMAAGNTPILDWNIFNGLRTLSANIAVEMPEAPKGGTLYRTLFLTALVLFVMTFIVNTIAEVVRLRFRKKAYQL